MIIAVIKNLFVGFFVVALFIAITACLVTEKFLFSFLLIGTAIIIIKRMVTGRRRQF